MCNKYLINSESQHPLFLAEMSYRQIEDHLKRIPCLVVPLGGLETYGKSGALGSAGICSYFICRELSLRLNVICAPDINYSCTGAFKAFPGCASLHHSTFINFLMNICHDWLFQGFKRILFINSIPDNNKYIEIVAQRINRLKKEDCIGFFDWQKNKRIGSFISKHISSNELGRSQKSILSMTAFLKPQLFSEFNDNESHRLPDRKIYSRWEKRGRDPVKFRKLFPSGGTSEDLLRYDSSFGEELFGYILEILEQEYSSFLEINP